MEIYLALMIGSAVFYGLAVLFGGDHHHGDIVHHDGDAHHHEGGLGYKDFFSIRSILLFMLGFGAAGALSTVLGVGALLIPVIGAAAGIFFSWMGIMAFRLLRDQEGTTTNTLAELEGHTGKVITAVPANGVGEISITNIRGEAQYLRIRSEDGEPISVGQTVQVVSAGAGDLIVRKSNLLPSAN